MDSRLNVYASAEVHKNVCSCETEQLLEIFSVLELTTMVLRSASSGRTQENSEKILQLLATCHPQTN